MTNKTIALLLVAATALPMNAQKSWSLRQCCDYAVEHNITVKQYDNQRRQRELQLSTARNSRLPDLNASAGQNFSFGRGLTAENTYTNTNTSSTSFSLGTSIPLFTGFQIPNNIHAQKTFSFATGMGSDPPEYRYMTSRDDAPGAPVSERNMASSRRK